MHSIENDNLENSRKCNGLRTVLLRSYRPDVMFRKGVPVRVWKQVREVTVRTEFHPALLVPCGVVHDLSEAKAAQGDSSDLDYTVGCRYHEYFDLRRLLWRGFGYRIVINRSRRQYTHNVSEFMPSIELTVLDYFGDDEISTIEVTGAYRERVYKRMPDAEPFFRYTLGTDSLEAEVTFDHIKIRRNDAVELFVNDFNKLLDPEVRAVLQKYRFMFGENFNLESCHSNFSSASNWFEIGGTWHEINFGRFKTSENWFQVLGRTMNGSLCWLRENYCKLASTDKIDTVVLEIMRFVDLIQDMLDLLLKEGMQPKENTDQVLANLKLAKVVALEMYADHTRIMVHADRLESLNLFESLAKVFLTCKSYEDHQSQNTTTSKLCILQLKSVLNTLKMRYQARPFLHVLSSSRLNMLMDCYFESLNEEEDPEQLEVEKIAETDLFCTKSFRVRVSGSFIKFAYLHSANNKWFRFRIQTQSLSDMGKNAQTIGKYKGDLIIIHVSAGYQIFDLNEMLSKIKGARNPKRLRTQPDLGILTIRDTTYDQAIIEVSEYEDFRPGYSYEYVKKKCFGRLVQNQISQLGITAILHWNTLGDEIVTLRHQAPASEKSPETCWSTVVLVEMVKTPGCKTSHCFPKSILHSEEQDLIFAAVEISSGDRTRSYEHLNLAKEKNVTDYDYEFYGYDFPFRREIKSAQVPNVILRKTLNTEDSSVSRSFVLSCFSYSSNVQGLVCKDMLSTLSSSRFGNQTWVIQKKMVFSILSNSDHPNLLWVHTYYKGKFQPINSCVGGRWGIVRLSKPVEKAHLLQDTQNRSLLVFQERGCRFDSDKLVTRFYTIRFCS